MFQRVVDQTPSSSGDSLKYIPQLDGLRAFALFAVFISHFLTYGRFTDVDWGRMGVVHFFVISGFLITTILLRNRDESMEVNSAKRHILRSFYARRFLRIFPIYYLTIFILYLVDYESVRTNIWWLLTYTMNISQGFYDGWYGYAAHFWSLCVEEQFYLFYPVMILFIRKNFIKRAILLGIVFSLSYKFIGSNAGFSWYATSWTLPGNLDSLGLGALYTYYIVFSDEHKRELRRLLIACAVIGIPLLLGLQALKLFWEAEWVKQITYYQTLIDLGISMPSILVIHLAVRQSQWLPGRLLSAAPIRYIGKISYGGYVYHNFMKLASFRADALVIFAVYSLMSLSLASLSWHVIENPINQLKKRIPYLGQVERQEVVTPIPG